MTRLKSDEARRTIYALDKALIEDFHTNVLEPKETKIGLSSLVDKEAIPEDAPEALEETRLYKGDAKVQVSSFSPVGGEPNRTRAVGEPILYSVLDLTGSTSGGHFWLPNNVVSPPDYQPEIIETGPTIYPAYALMIIYQGDPGPRDTAEMFEDVEVLLQRAGI